jgi:drug/metabolite transporter (DMT)-like permease
VVSGHLLGAALSVTVSLCLTLQALAIRFGTRQGRANDALVTVFLFNVASFAVVVALRHSSYEPTLASLGAFAGAGIVGTLFGTAFYYAGIERIGASRSDAIKASQPMPAAFFAVLVLGEYVTFLNGLGIVLVVLGVAVLVAEGSTASPTGGRVRAGVLYSIGASAAFGLEPVFAKYGFALGTPVFVGLLVKTATAAVGLLWFLRWREGLTLTSVGASLRSKWYVVAGVANTLSLVAYYYALTVAPVAVVIPLTQLSPLLVMVLSYRYLPDIERITPRLVAGGVCIVLGGVAVVLFG